MSKKKYSFFLLGIILFFSSMVCKEKNKHQHHTMDPSKPGDMSLHLLESNWQTEKNQKTTLAKLSAGKNQVLAMVYLNCEYVCPRIVADMKYLRKNLSWKAQNSTDFILVTIDPKRDTVTSFLEYKKRLKLNEPQWHFLRGNEGDVRELAAVLGVKYKKLDDGGFSHSNILTVLNAQGEVTFQQQGIQNKINETLKAIEEISD